MGFSVCRGLVIRQVSLASALNFERWLTRKFTLFLNTTLHLTEEDKALSRYDIPARTLLLINANITRSSCRFS
jgi:hypothetical protein